MSYSHSNATKQLNLKKHSNSLFCLHKTFCIIDQIQNVKMQNIMYLKIIYLHPNWFFTRHATHIVRVYNKGFKKNLNFFKNKGMCVRSN